MKKPILQILVVTYNQLNLVNKMASSIRRYACEEIQVFVQDDGSTDGTYEALRDALKSTPFAKVMRNETNIGAVKNASTLIEKATADYVLNIGGDDYFFADSADKIITTLKTDSPDLLIGTCYLTSSINIEHRFFGGKIDGRIEGTPKNVDYVRFIIKSQTTENQQITLKPAAEIPGLLWTQGVIFKTSLLQKTQLLTESDVDDWGILHNFAVYALHNTLFISAVEVPFSLVTSCENSRGSQVLKQLERQLSAIINFWHEDFKKNALLNALEKKIVQLRKSSYSADEIISSLRKGLENEKFE